MNRKIHSDFPHGKMVTTKTPNTEEGQSLWTAKIISQGQQNARRDSTFSVKNEGLSNISSAKATQTEPSPER